VFLGRALRKYRLRKGFSAPEAARRTGISVAKLRKLEAATNEAIKITDVLACSTIYECSGEESRDLVGLAESSDSPGWYHDFDVSTDFVRFLEMEGAADEIHIYEEELVNGRFQVEEYVEVLRQHRPGTKGGADQGLRARRQELIFGDNGPEVIYLTSEAALRREIGSPAVMHKQVQRLLELNRRERIQVLVIPFAAGAHESMGRPYELMRFRDGVFPVTVYLESLHGSHYEDDDRKVSQYWGAFKKSQQFGIDIERFINGNDGLA
jgi:transcriptional regulator with XRE-family HTH domain